jgi:hypothetical protein
MRRSGAAAGQCCCAQTDAPNLEKMSSSSWRGKSRGMLRISTLVCGAAARERQAHAASEGFAACHAQQAAIPAPPGARLGLAVRDASTPRRRASAAGARARARARSRTPTRAARTAAAAAAPRRLAPRRAARPTRAAAAAARAARAAALAAAAAARSRLVLTKARRVSAAGAQATYAAHAPPPWARLRQAHRPPWSQEGRKL